MLPRRRSRLPQRGALAVLLALFALCQAAPAAASSSDTLPAAAAAPAALKLLAGYFVSTSDEVEAIVSTPIAKPSVSTRTERARAWRQARRLDQLSWHLAKFTWHWQRVIGVKPSPRVKAPPRLDLVSRARYRLRAWKQRATSARYSAAHPPHLRQWLCIHGGVRYGARWGTGEGSWVAHTGNGYYGGLQMDLTFQRNYGRYLLRLRGTADHWSPKEQIWIAEHGRRVQGWHARPRTAHACGLI